MSHHTPAFSENASPSLRELPTLFDDGDDEVTSPEIEIDIQLDGPTYAVLPWANAHTQPLPAASATSPSPSPWRRWLVAVSVGSLVAFGSSLEARPPRAEPVLSTVVDSDEIARFVGLAREDMDESALLPIEPVVTVVAASVPSAIALPGATAVRGTPERSEPEVTSDSAVETAESAADAELDFDPAAAVRGAFATHSSTPSHRKMLVPDLDDRRPEGTIDYAWRPSDPERATRPTLPPPTRLSPDSWAHRGRLEGSPAARR